MLLFQISLNLIENSLKRKSSNSSSTNYYKKEEERNTTTILSYTEIMKKYTEKSTKLIMMEGIICHNSYVIKFKDKMLTKPPMEKSFG